MAAGFRPDPLGELTALPQTPSCIKEGERWKMGMKERWKGKESERKEIVGKEGKLGIMEYVSRIVKVHYGQPYRLAPLKCLGFLWSPHSKKLAPPLISVPAAQGK